MEKLNQMKAVMDDARDVDSTADYAACGRRAAALIGANDDFRSLDDVAEVFEVLNARIVATEASLELFR